MHYCRLRGNDLNLALISEFSACCLFFGRRLEAKYCSQSNFLFSNPVLVQ